MKPGPNERCPSPVGRLVTCLLAGLAGGIVLALVGLFVGATYGGNFATDFEFNGQRGCSRVRRYTRTAVVGSTMTEARLFQKAGLLEFTNLINH